MELSELPNEKFKDDFTNWLIEQYPKNFINLNGYEILKSYINFRYGDGIVFDRKDYQFFVSFKREIIVEIKIWLATFQLTFEDYKIYFELFIEDLNLNYKSSFEKILDLYNSYLISEDFIIEKNEINKLEISNIFNKKIIENRLANNLKNENHLKKCIHCEYLLSEEELNRSGRHKSICTNCLDKLKSSKRKEIIKKCIQCECLLSEEELNRSGRYKSICINCLDKIKASKYKEVVLKCTQCNCLLSKEELKRKHQYKTICINCLDERKRDYQKDYRKNYKLQNPEKSKEQKRRYKKNRMKRDITFKIVHRLRTRILLVLHGKKKAESSMNLLGCTAEYFKKHLEAQFKDDMSWENYGIKGWHIDHIKPCASFDFSIIEEQKECFHYTNLQPLWWYDNLAKSDKIL
jgi:hypothetical protein